VGQEVAEAALLGRVAAGHWSGMVA
jgi:hypothetical protein